MPARLGVHLPFADQFSDRNTGKIQGCSTHLLVSWPQSLANWIGFLGKKISGKPQSLWFPHAVPQKIIYFRGFSLIKTIYFVVPPWSGNLPFSYENPDVSCRFSQENQTIKIINSPSNHHFPMVFPRVFQGKSPSPIISHVTAPFCRSHCSVTWQRSTCCKGAVVRKKWEEF